VSETKRLRLRKVKAGLISESTWSFSSPSFALDLFRLVIVDGKATAEFSCEWYKENLVSEMPANITWGGSFKKFPDCPHFEVTGWAKMPRIKIWEKG